MGRVVPAHEGFDADDAARREVDLRLIVGSELAVSNPSPLSKIGSLNVPRTSKTTQAFSNQKAW